MQLKEPSNARSVLDDNQMEHPYSGGNPSGGQDNNGYYNGMNSGVNPYSDSYGDPYSGNMGNGNFGNNGYDGGFGTVDYTSSPTVLPKSGGNKTLKVTIAVIAGILLFGVCFWLFTEQPWRKGGIKKITDADEAIKSFVEVILSGDRSKVADFYEKYSPKELTSKMKKTSEYQQLLSMEDGLKTLIDQGVNIDITYTTFYKTRLSSDEQKSLKNKMKVIDSSISFKDAYYVDVPFTMTVKYNGVSKSEPYNFRFTFVKMGSRWYMVDADKQE